ncbi:MAG: galactokinase [Planctomycetota bacterium]
MTDQQACDKLLELARQAGLRIRGGRIRRTSSRFCLGVEHGDYNGTELFGVGTDRFIWLASKPNDVGSIRLFSGNFPQEGVIEIDPAVIPKPKSPEIRHTWARFPLGVFHVLKGEGIVPSQGFDAVIYGNIPGGGMSRSASLTLNLILTVLESNEIPFSDPLKIVDRAQAVENDYIGSPCGQLDQIMILFARQGKGTHYNPRDRSVRYVPLGKGAPDFRLVGLDTGTERPGLEKSTYKVRRAECEELVALAADEFKIACLADIKDGDLYDRIRVRFETTRPELCDRMHYIFHAQQRFYEMLDAWERGDIETVGRVFREDGFGLRDQYRISGPELETMCDIARSVPGVLGERMLGGGDKGASGAIVLADHVDALKSAVDEAYPRTHPSYADRHAVHVCKAVEGVTVLDGLL